MSKLPKNTVRSSSKKWIAQSPGPAWFPGCKEAMKRTETGALSAKSVTPAVIHEGVTP